MSAAAAKSSKPKKRCQQDSTLIKLLGSSDPQRQQHQADKKASVLLQAAVATAAAAPSRGNQQHAAAQRHSTPHDTFLCRSQSRTQQTQTSALHIPSASAKQPQTKVQDALAASHGPQLQECPLCGQHLPVSQLQQHVDAELAELEGLHSPPHTAAGQHGPAPWPSQQQHMRHCTSQEQHQQQQGHCTDSWRPGGPAHHQKAQQTQDWCPVQPQQPLQNTSTCPPLQSQPHPKRQRVDHHWQQQELPHQQQQQPHLPAQQQPRQQRSRANSHRSSSSSSSSRVGVKSLSAAPKRPVGPDGQPILQADGGFDHWGDSTLNYLVRRQREQGGMLT